MTEESLFELALNTPKAERAALLDRECGGNPELRQRIEVLLQAHAEPAADFLNPPQLRQGDETGAYASSRGGPAGERPSAVIAGKYKLLQQIGEGGMGSVWMADQTEPVKRRVAVKLIRAERGSSSTILARFEAERQAIALMDHPHIARLLDAGTTEAGAPFFVMELVKGIPLTEFCDTHQLTIPERLHLFQQVCVAVQHAHHKGIIHRDLKPSNVLVESHDGQPVPKVIDFGLAKATSGMQLTEHTLFTGFGTVAGTPLYMAPEQAYFNAVDIDTRADVYALGVLLYEMLTGTTPITRETAKKAALDEMLRLIREQEAPTPSSRLSGSDSKPAVSANRGMEPAKLGRFVKGELDWIVLKALSKERDRRYETANGFAKDIERFLNHEPVQAGPPSVSYRLRKFVRRNRPQVIAASLVLLALVAGIIGTTVGLVRAEQQRQLAEDARQGEAARAEAEAEQRKRAVAAEDLAKTRLGEVTKQKERADEEAAIARAVYEFIQKDILSQANSVMQANRRFVPDPALTVRTALDRAAAKSGTAFKDQPKVEAAIRRTIGNAYLGVGEYDKAIEHLKRSVELCIGELGPDHPDTLTSMNNLAGGYYFTGKLDLALPLLEQTLKLSKAKLGPDHPNTLKSMNNLAVCYGVAGKLDLALPLYEETLKLYKAKLGPDHPGTLKSMNNLALGYWSAKQFDKSIPLFEQTLAAYRKKLGGRHPTTLLAMANLGVNYRDAGRLKEAIPLLEQAYRDGRGRASLNGVGDALLLAYSRAGKTREGTNLAKALVAEAREALPAGGMRLAGALAVNGLALLQLKAWSNAEPILRESLAIREKKLPDAWSTFNAQSMLGGALLGQARGASKGSDDESLARAAGLYRDAEPLLLKGYEGMKRRQAKIPPQVRRQRLEEALDRLIQLAEATNNPEDLKKWQAEKAKLPKAPTPPPKGDPK